MASLERFQHELPSESREYQGKTGDAVIDFFNVGDNLYNFTSFRLGDYRSPFFIPEKNRIYLPFGSDAGINFGDEEILLKHMKKKREKEHGVVFLFIGGSIIERQGEKGIHYRMDDADPYYLTNVESYLSFGDFQIRCKFIIR